MRMVLFFKRFEFLTGVLKPVSILQTNHFHLHVPVKLFFFPEASKKDRLEIQWVNGSPTTAEVTEQYTEQ